jgi:succinate dehydrogenase / fumarate reductase cytochrome b subunit
MSWFVSYVRSSVGAKQMMAVTGLGLLLFALVHMIGHLGMFSGRDAYNTYAHTLQSLGALKWIARGGLLAIFVIHLVTGIRLAAANRAARPQKYVVHKLSRTSFYARSMALTGLVILAFVVYHLAHFTLGWVQPDYFHLPDGKGRNDAYTMFVMGFESTPILISYLVAVTLLCLHLAEAGQPGQPRKLSVIIVGTGLAGGAAAATLGEAGYHVKASASRTPRAGPTRSPPRAASTPPRTTRRTATPSTACSTTPSRAATTAPARPTSTAWPRSAPTSSTSASPRACRSPASTAVCSTTAPSAASRCRAPSTPAARPASSC